MSFCYVNPGCAEMLDSDSGTTVKSYAYNFIEGVSFWDANSTSNIHLGSVPTELYIRVSVFIRGTSDMASAKIYAGNNVGLSILQQSASSWRMNIYSGDSELRQYNSCAECNLNLGKNDILIHAKAGYYSSGLFVFNVNGEEIYNQKITVKFDQSNSSKTPSDAILLRSDNDKLLFSNVIISDSEVTWNEKVASLTAKATDTDMTANEDGSYTASTAGQYLFQSLDVDALIDTYGEASPVTGVFLAGRPAYATGSDLTKAVACGRQNGAVTEYGTVELGTDKAAHVLIGSRLSLTLGDLRMREFGWKAGI